MIVGISLRLAAPPQLAAPQNRSSTDGPVSPPCGYGDLYAIG